MTGKRLAYARVSTRDQNPDLQEKALERAGYDRLFVEKASGAKRDRPELAALLDYAREGDTIVIWRLDRLARSVSHLVELSADLKKRGINLVSIHDTIDTSSATGMFFFHMLASMAQFEHELMMERITAGVEAAKARGIDPGRPRADKKPELAQKLAYALKLVEDGQSVAAAARASGLARSTITKYRKPDVSKINGKGVLQSNGLRQGLRSLPGGDEPIICH